MSKPTMADVASRAGVDVSTVSRALNERTSNMLRAETLARVLEAATELGYRPNTLARGLRTQRSNTVGMLIPDLTNPFFPPVVRGVEDALDARDYTLILANTDNDLRREGRGLETLVARQVDGLLIATSHLQDNDDGPTAALPVVLVNRRADTADLSAIVPDDRQGVSLVLDHLLGLGHRRIGHVAGPFDTSTGRTRAEAFEAHAAEHGVFDAALVERTAVYAVEAGHAACAALLERRPDVTAICAGNDLLAIGCYRALRDRGARVPDDVSVVGFNDMPLVDLLAPPLTTVRIPQYDMGFRAGEMLLDLVLGRAGASEPSVIELPGTLVVRGSTGPPRVDRETV